MSDPKHEHPGYETRDADLRQVVFAGLGVAAGTLFVCLLMWGLFNTLKTAEAPPVAQTGPSPWPPEPRLAVQPWEQIQQLRREEEEVLKTYGWVDQRAGKVHIPIDRAMDLMAQRGLRVQGGASAPPR